MRLLSEMWNKILQSRSFANHLYKLLIAKYFTFCHQPRNKKIHSFSKKTSNWESFHNNWMAAHVILSIWLMWVNSNPLVFANIMGSIHHINTFVEYQIDRKYWMKAHSRIYQINNYLQCIKGHTLYIFQSRNKLQIFRLYKFICLYNFNSESLYIL
jgi:hypothetical protein